MRFSITAISLLSLVLGSNALPGDPVDPGYTRSWDLAVGGYGRWRGVNTVLLDNGELYMANGTKPSTGTPLRFELIGSINIAGEIITAAKLVGYPGYSTVDQGLYMWQQEGGTFVYGVFDDSPVYLKSWWLKKGPSNDPQWRLTLDGNSTAKALWNDSKGRYNIYIGSGIPADRVQDMIDVDLKVTTFCGPGPTDYCF